MKKIISRNPKHIIAIDGMSKQLNKKEALASTILRDTETSPE